MGLEPVRGMADPRGVRGLKMESQVLSIRGMTCAACALRIEKTVRKLPGLAQASVNLASEKLFVEYDADSLQLSQIKEAVSKIGYEVAEKDGRNR